MRHLSYKSIFISIGFGILLPAILLAQSVCVDLTRTLSLGSRDSATGGQVSQLQSFLVSQNLLTPDLVTGYFGPLTEGAVKRLQCNNNLICSGSPASTGWGVVGPRTRALIKNLTCGASPVSCTLTAEDPIIYKGESTMLSWTSQGAAGGTITPGIGSVGPSGSQSVSPLQTTTYLGTFTGAGAGGMAAATCQSTVIVLGDDTDPSTGPVSFTATPMSGATPLAVSFRAAGGDEEGYRIHFGDGESAIMTIAGSDYEVRVATHTYSHAGTYVATLTDIDTGATVFCGSGSNRTACKVTIIATGTGTTPPPSGPLQAYPTSGSAPLSVNFWYALSTGEADHYSIDFGDNTSGTPSIGCAVNPQSGSNACPRGLVASHTYQSAGTYTAKLNEGSDPAFLHGSIIITITGSGTTGWKPIFTASSPTSGQSPLGVWFSVSNGTNSDIIDFGDGASQSVNGVKSLTLHTYVYPGMYKARLKQPYTCGSVTCWQWYPNVDPITITVTGTTASGVSGRVMKGPSCGAVQGGGSIDCSDKPFQTTVNIYKNSALVKSISSDANGFFGTGLEAGTYEFRANEGSSSVYPRCNPVIAQVSSSGYTNVLIFCDTGIR